MKSAGRPLVSCRLPLTSVRWFRADYHDQAGGSAGLYGHGSAPKGWDNDGVGKNDHEVQRLKQGTQGMKLTKEYGYDMSARDNTQGGAAGIPVFKLRLEKKSQADIDAENKGLNMVNLTEEQRERIRLRRNKRAVKEEAVFKTRHRLRMFNRGRGNLGFLNAGDDNVGFLNFGDGNKGIFNAGDYNAGMLCYGNDNKGAFIWGKGNIGGLIWGNHSRGVEIWGDKQRGAFQTSDAFMKLRMRCCYIILVCIVLTVPIAYTALQRRQRKRWLEAMDLGDKGDEGIEIMMQRKSF